MAHASAYNRLNITYFDVELRLCTYHQFFAWTQVKVLKIMTERSNGKRYPGMTIDETEHFGGLRNPRIIDLTGGGFTTRREGIIR